MLVFLLLAFTVLSSASAQQTSPPNGVVCNYPTTGDESTQSAVPIATFRTSGLDFVRRQWCITHCQDRTSLKAQVLFNLTTDNSPSYKIRKHFTKSGGLKISTHFMDGTPAKKRRDDGGDDDFNFCLDDAVSKAVDDVVNKFDDIETMSEALNYYVNRPGWAFLIYDMGKPPTLVVTENVKQDPNYCEKTVIKNYGMYSVFGGLIQTTQ